MKLAVLSRQPALYANRRLQQAAAARGMSVVFADPLHADAEDACFDGVDAVIPRFTPRWQSPGGRLSAALERRGIHAVNGAAALALTRDRVRSAACFLAAGLPMPETCRPDGMPDAAWLAALPFGFPMLLKRDDGAQGEGVERLPDADRALARIHAMVREGIGFQLQEYIAEAAGTDVRLMVLNGEVVAAMRRIARPGEFRANIHLGGRADAYIPDSVETALARTAVAVLGLDLGGVDILRTLRGPLLLEVNACPGFEALEAATGCDFAGKLLDFLASRILPQNGALYNQNIRGN